MLNFFLGLFSQLKFFGLQANVLRFPDLLDFQFLNFLLLFSDLFIEDSDLLLKNLLSSCGDFIFLPDFELLVSDPLELHNCSVEFDISLLYIVNAGWDRGRSCREWLGWLRWLTCLVSWRIKNLLWWCHLDLCCNLFLQLIILHL